MEIIAIVLAAILFVLIILFVTGYVKAGKGNPSETT